MVRCFISIKVPKQICPWIKGIQNDIRYFKGRKVDSENFHLTLKFLGEISVEEIDKVKERLLRLNSNSFKTQVDSLGVFSEDFVRIIWLHLNNCEELQKKIDDVLGDLFPRAESFKSHLTLARVNSVKNKKIFFDNLKNISLPNIEFEVCEFFFMKSVLTKNGPVYDVIDSYRLE